MESYRLFIIITRGKSTRLFKKRRAPITPGNETNETSRCPALDSNGWLDNLVKRVSRTVRCQRNGQFVRYSRGQTGYPDVLIE